MKIFSEKFFSYYLFHPKAKELKCSEKSKAVITTLALGLFTCGLVHLVCFIKYRNRKFAHVASNSSLSKKGADIVSPLRGELIPKKQETSQQRKISNQSPLGQTSQSNVTEIVKKFPFLKALADTVQATSKSDREASAFAFEMSSKYKNEIEISPNKAKITLKILEDEGKSGNHYACEALKMIYWSKQPKLALAWHYHKFKTQFLKNGDEEALWQLHTLVCDGEKCEPIAGKKTEKDVSQAIDFLMLFTKKNSRRLRKEAYKKLAEIYLSEKGFIDFEKAENALKQVFTYMIGYGSILLFEKTPEPYLLCCPEDIADYIKSLKSKAQDPVCHQNLTREIKR